MTLPSTWTPEEIADILAKANGLYGTLVGLTSTPREAAEIICMMHMLLYFNCGDASHSVDEMLSEYSANFKTNFEAQSKEMAKVAN
jgi:hypothetical protein